MVLNVQKGGQPENRFKCERETISNKTYEKGFVVDKIPVK